MDVKWIIDRIVEGEETHPELANFRGMFSVNPLEAGDLIQNIGRWVAFRRTSRMGLIHELPHKVMHVQKIYDGSLAYRCENQKNTFGCPASPREVVFISLDQARDLWNSKVTSICGEFELFDPNFDKHQ